VVSIDKLAVDDVSRLQDDRSGRVGVMLALVSSHLATAARHGSIKKRARTMAATTTAAHDLKKIARRSSLAEGLDLLEGFRRKTITYNRSDSMRILLRVLYTNGSNSRSHTSDDRIHTRFSATHIRINRIIREIGLEGDITRAEDGVEVLEGKNVVDLFLTKTLSKLGNARTNKDGLAARITLLADLTDVVHRRSSVADGRLDLGDVLVNHVDPSRAARSGHERKSSSFLLLVHFHTFIEFSSLSKGGHISTNSDLDANIETSLDASLLERSDGDGMREVTSNSRSKHGNHLTVGIEDTTGNISDFSARLNSTEGAVAYTLTTADALVKVEDLTIIRKGLDGTNRAVSNTRSDLMDDSTERTSLGAITTADTLGGIDMSLASGVIDSLLCAGLSARTSSAVLAHVSHDVLLLGATMANIVHESKDRKSKIAGFTLHGLLGKLCKRLTIILLTFQTKSSNDTAANFATLNSIFFRNKFLRKIFNLLDKLIGKNETADTLHDIIFHLDNTVRNGRNREVHFSLRGLRNSRVGRGSSHREKLSKNSSQ